MLKQEKQQSDERFGLYATQAQTYASFAGTMTAVVLFFTGLLLANFDSFALTIKIPIAFLIISIFGFLYGALLYANASEEVVRFREPSFFRAMYLGDVISEYLGIYLLVVSIPLILNTITEDSFLRVVTLISALGGLAVYQFSGFAIAERHFKVGYRYITTGVLLIAVGLFIAQINQTYLVELAFLMLGYVALLVIGAIRARPKLSA